ncbi:hypothetical protein HP548_02595 [Paenibacillus taichungensis]|uniref:Uncharacterized protein n=2 Tax=Paenibacillus taichungensis TaxID=484184 RepID=A0ABX2MEI4_9BACL|nr:hypothetical protein [Paenibacillus taichungensis]
MIRTRRGKQARLNKMKEMNFMLNQIGQWLMDLALVKNDPTLVKQAENCGLPAVTFLIENPKMLYRMSNEDIDCIVQHALYKARNMDNLLVIDLAELHR